MITAFLIYWQGSIKPIVLRPGESCELSHWAPHDEGWSSEGVTFTHEGDVIRREWGTDGRDCDGRMTRGGEDICPLDQLQAREAYGFDLPFRLPEWQEESTAPVYDEYAQAMGY